MDNMMDLFDSFISSKKKILSCFMSEGVEYNDIDAALWIRDEHKWFILDNHLYIENKLYPDNWDKYYIWHIHSAYGYTHVKLSETINVILKNAHKKD
ncbi:MAG: hypothetical protein KKC80_08760 [Candidatus Margulisbacteria bacterium]|nr:hypothetical protein [Candidatus Margulisiibacteriota bacterium]